MVSGPRTRPRAEFGLRFGTESLLRFTTPADMPQIRDLQYLITYGSSFFHDEQHHLRTHTECPWPNVLAYRVINSDPEDRYQIRKEIITDPHMSCVLQHTKLDGDAQFLSRLRLYVLCALHLGLEGGNNGPRRRKKVRNS
jgi:glucoamylase